MAGALTPVAETLTPRAARVALRRTPIAASGKTTADTPVLTAHGGTNCLASVASIFTQLVQFIFGWQGPVCFAAAVIGLGDTRSTQ